MTDPTPVITAQPSRAPSSSGSASGTFTIALRCTSISSAKRAEPGHLGDLLIAASDPRRAVGALAERLTLLAQPGVADQALAARAAVHRQARDDPVTRLELGDVGTDRLHDAGSLVSEHGRNRRRQVPVDHVQIAVAQTAGDRLDQHLVGLGGR